MNNSYKFFKHMLELSKSKDWESAKKEWKQTNVTYASNPEEWTSCICSHFPIAEQIEMTNSLIKHKVIIGNCCINKFFDIKINNKLFSSLKKDKVNKYMIEDSFSKKRITEWEKDFMLSIWRKRKLTEKQKEVKAKIQKRIIEVYRR